jgi:hypothetical protein
VSAPVRQLEDLVGEILKLVKWSKEEREKGQASEDSQVKKRTASPSEVSRSSRLNLSIEHAVKPEKSAGVVKDRSMVAVTRG